MKAASLNCVVLGGGGHAKVVIDALGLAFPGIRIGVLDTDDSRHGASLLGAPILGGDEYLAKCAGEGFGHFIVGLGGAGDLRPRQALFAKAKQAGLDPLSVIHPAASVSASACLGAGTVVLAAAVVNADAEIGENAIINTRAIIEHDCVLNDHVHCAPGSCLLGGVALGAGATVGAGAVVRQGVRIGTMAFIGAGAVVLDDVAAETTVAGVPARPMA